MRNPDFAIYTVHGLFWSAFGLTRIIVSRRNREPHTVDANAQSSRQETTARFSRALVAFHALAFAVMYLGIAIAVIPRRIPVWFAGQRIAGALVIAVGAALVVWALLSFRSWRFRASVDSKHQLATGGPFRLMRHPIYMGLNLLALGSALWIPSALVWIGFVWMAIGGDLRAGAEETILTEAFGNAYREYCARTRRFLPGIY